MRFLLRRLFRCLGLPSGYASGGSVLPSRPRPGEHLVVLSPGRRIDDPDEAEALGLTADARRMRRQGTPPLPRPDYAEIDRLERELGMQVEEQRPIVRPDRVCLTKDCRGDTQAVEAWGGQVLFRIHRCEG